MRLLGRREGPSGFPGGPYTLLCLRWTTSKGLRYGSRKPARRHAAAWLGSAGGEGAHVHVRLGRLTVHLTPSQQLPAATPGIHNKNTFFKMALLYVPDRKAHIHMFYFLFIRLPKSAIKWK